MLVEGKDLLGEAGGTGEDGGVGHRQGRIAFNAEGSGC